MMDMYEKIGEIAAGFENDMVDFARRLIQTKSISGTEGGVAKLYQDEMKKLGYDEVFQDAAGNVIGLIRGDEEGPTIMFNSHMDHVVKVMWQTGKDMTHMVPRLMCVKLTIARKQEQNLPNVFMDGLPQIQRAAVPYRFTPVQLF